MKKLILLVLVVALTGGIVFLLNKDKQAGNTEPDDSEIVFCTADALICPDGSGVGRTGPSCEFSPCPNQESFTGTLLQEGGEFRLLVVSVPDLPPEMEYTLPLKFSRVSNVLGTLVGKEVRVSGTFITGNTLEVETIEEASE